MPASGNAAPYALLERLPTPEEYRRLCEAVGWGPVMNFEAAPTSLERSLYGVVALHLGHAIGMARVVDDGAIYHYLQDGVVDPAHQRRGIGHRLVRTAVAHVHAHAPDRAFLGVFAAQGTERFYRGAGFERHDALTGMFQVKRPDPPQH
ncbi:MAG: GNAT family N-acetyltransferase [Deinococcales bacterium]